MDLKCRQLNCKNNDCYCCTCKGIAVTNDGMCASYEEYEGELPPRQQQDVSRDMFEKEPKVHPYRHNKKVDIHCDCVNCLFNNDRTCYSNGITLQHGSNTAECITRIKE